MGKYEKEKPPGRFLEKLTRFVTLAASLLQIIEIIRNWLDG